MDSELAVSGTRKFFTYGTIASKILILLLLIVFSYVHVNPAFISKKPRTFLTESILTGAAVALPAVWILHNRGMPWMSTISVGVSAFMIFYLYAIFSEFSGANEATDKYAKNGVTQWIVIIIGIIMLTLSLVVHDFTPGFGTIFMETMVIGLSGASLELYKAYNRGHTDYVAKFVKMFGLISLTHIILQFGGLYTQLGGTPVNNFESQSI